MQMGLLSSMPTVWPRVTRGPTPVRQPVLAAEAGRAFLDAWQKGDYHGMYALVSQASQTSHDRDHFVGRYQDITEGVQISATKADSGALSWPGSPGKAIDTQATLPFTVTMTSSRFGDIVEQNSLPLVRDTSGWRVDWKPSLILNGLADDNVVKVIPDDPVRGAILDRKGRVLAGEGSLLSVGLVPGKITDEAEVLSALSSYLGMDKETIKARYANAKPDWWVPLRDLPIDRKDEAKGKLGGIDGIMLQEKPSRVYPEKELAAHVVGYVSPVTADDLQKLAGQGYEDGDFIGRTSIEAWTETTLAGKKGGKLVIQDGNGDVVRTVAERPAVPGGQVHLTLDIDLQRKAEQILGDRVGSVIMIDARDNSILAMASHPGFDPNSFIIGMSDAEWKKLSDDQRHPFQNRAALSTYPTGSIFKVVTMAAALEKGGFVPTSPFHCPGHWTAPGGREMACWVPSGHGDLTLFDALVESCNVTFFQLGQALNDKDPNSLPSFASQFGLGKATGVVGLVEAGGTVPDPEWKQQTLNQPWYVGDAVNLAIGQGYLEATPLQMANLYSALAANGVLRRPVLVSSVDDGGAGEHYQADEIGQLPASAETLKTIRQAMVRVTSDPKGTGYFAFQGYGVSTAGKTGSAENENPEAHAWFAGYAPADNPQVVVVAMVEGGEHGGQVAAPLGRQLLEAYFGK